MLKEQEAGAKAADLARRHGVSEATIYNWKAKYGGVEVSEAKRLRPLEDENAKLKRCWPRRCWITPVLRIFPQKIGNARCQSKGGLSSPGGSGDERAAGVPCCRH